MTRLNPERPPGPSYYRLPEASWALIREEYLAGWSAKAIGRKWRVSMTSIYRHATDGGWRKSDQSRALGDEIAAAGEEDAWPREEWTSLKDPLPPFMRRGPHPLPGMGPVRRPAWEPPPGYGPMPPHLVPPVQRPEPPSPLLEDEGDAPSAGEAADRAVSAAARALTAGRYQEAERLGRLAMTMRKISGAPPAAKPKRADAFFSVEDEEELPENERPLACTPDTCVVLKEREEAYAKVAWLFGERLKGHDVDDVLAWADMMEGLGAPIADEDVRRLVDTLKAEGPGQVHRLIDEVVGRPAPSNAIYNPAAPANPDAEPNLAHMRP